MSSAKTTTTTMTSGNRPRRPSTEGMSGLPITVNVHSKARTSTIGYMGWLGSMASGMSDYLHSPREHEHESTVSSSTHSLSFSGPPSPAHTTALPDWSPRAANRVPGYSPLLFVILLFPLSTALVIGTVWTLPVRLPGTDDDTPHSVFPRTISEVRALAWALKGYSETGSWELVHVLVVLAVAALWKHAWSVPGSVLLNILTGTLLPPVLATLLQTSLTTLGSVLSTILATPLTPIITRFFPSAIDVTRSALEGPSASASSSSRAVYPPSSSPSVLSSTTTLRDSLSRPPSPSPALAFSKPQPSTSNNSSPWARLAVLRLIGIVPWSGINVACGVCGVALRHCALGAFIGTLPWTAVTCQIGDILQTFASSPVSPNSSNGTHQTISSIITSPQTIFKLFILTFISLAPILARERLSNWLNGVNSDGTIHEEKEQFVVEERKSRHKKRFSVEWWRRSLSLARTGKDGEETLELLGVSPDDRA